MAKTAVAMGGVPMQYPPNYIAMEGGAHPLAAALSATASAPATPTPAATPPRTATIPPWRWSPTPTPTAPRTSVASPTPTPTPPYATYTTTPTPPETPTPTSIYATYTVTPEYSCAVSYTMVSQSDSTFEAYVYMRNTGSVTIPSWRLEWDFPGDQQMTWHSSSMIGGQSGRHVAFYGVFSFQDLYVHDARGAHIGGTYSGTNDPPARFTINSVPCQIE
ncbi:hypothetical protein F8S13_02545 [Chloroflexia bacterium SDU3-3]|nr:hypothetical protein F8S13_02545 [Chloroflexia bacterium SDU3-3]